MRARFFLCHHHMYYSINNHFVSVDFASVLLTCVPYLCVLCVVCPRVGISSPIYVSFLLSSKTLFSQSPWVERVLPRRCSEEYQRKSSPLLT